MLNALKRKQYQHDIDTSIDIDLSILPISKDVKTIINDINAKVEKRNDLYSHDLNAIITRQEKLRKLKEQGLTGDSDVDRLIKMHRILNKLGYIKD